MKRELLTDTLKRDRNLLILFLAMTAVNLTVFLLYRILTEAFWYAEAILFLILLLLILTDYLRGRRRADRLALAKCALANGDLELPPASGYEARQYREMIDVLARRINAMQLSFAEENADREDWYTAWVHRIKTPIAVLKLQIPENAKDAARELFRIEEYADMALSYIRLGSPQNDLVIGECAPDELIRETLRKYAAQFIAGRIRLVYTPTEERLITDPKWFSCILEQFISNAVKYTGGGTVTVTFADGTLTVADTGIGIAPEDLPRIFEKGYTGCNGRGNAKSSGLGLYLAARAAKLIGATVSAESLPGQGSTFSVRFPEQARIPCCTSRLPDAFV